MKIFKTKTLENSFIKYKSVGQSYIIPCAKKDLKFALVAELGQLMFTYIKIQSSKIAKARAHSVEGPEYTSVQSSGHTRFLQGFSLVICVKLNYLFRKVM